MYFTSLCTIGGWEGAGGFRRGFLLAMNRGDHLKNTGSLAGK